MEWINVKDRLPTRSVTILFCTEDVHSEVLQFIPWKENLQKGPRLIK